MQLTVTLGVASESSIDKIVTRWRESVAYKAFHGYDAKN